MPGEYEIRHGGDLLGATIVRVGTRRFVCWCREVATAERITNALRELDLADGHPTDRPEAASDPDKTTFMDLAALLRTERGK